MGPIGVDWTNLQAWPSEGHFASWLGVCPINDISGGKVLRRGTRRVLNRATVAFRQAASTLLRSQSYLGAQYRRLRTRLGAPKAITAVAHKLAVLVYRMLKHGEAYVKRGADEYEAQYQDRRLAALRRSASELGFRLEPLPAQ